MRLSDPLNAELPSDPTATGTIIDDDDPPGITIADARAVESAGEVAFPVSLDAPSGRQVTVSYGTEDGTAKAGEDYGAAEGTLTFAAGQTSATGFRWRTTPWTRPTRPSVCGSTRANRFMPSCCRSTLRPES